MDRALSLFEESVKNRPEEWLWIHNRWKQQTLDAIKRPYRHDCIALFLPDDQPLIQGLTRVRLLYPTEHLVIYLPEPHTCPIDAEVHPYNRLSDTLAEDYRLKCIFNFTEDRKIEKHYKRLAAQSVLHVKTIDELEMKVRRA
jgi:Kdo2-lipid IVA lauroyltransferase/acyltransferase